MAFKPSEITKEHVLSAVQKIESENIELIPSTRWDVTINGKTYPPKEVMRYAHEAMNGEKIWERSGGEPTNKYLEKLGFKITEKGEKIKKIIEGYIKHIQKNGFDDELYKWELLSKYKGMPHTNSSFQKEITEIKYANLVYKMASAVSLDINNKKPDEYLKCFKNLFNEDVPLASRIKLFSQDVADLYSQITPDEKFSHHHDERTIATILTFKYPDKYTFYKKSFYKQFCQILGVKQKPVGEKYVHYLELIQRFIEEYILQNDELLRIKKEKLPTNVYQDFNHNILAQDILYQVFDKNILSQDESNPENNNMPPEEILSSVPLNQILYGPPGTGKTYHTINKAVEIISPDFKYNTRDELINQFKNLKNEGRIEFITFHQSFSYEDFIEGIKPSLYDEEDEKNEISYEIRPGVFKNLCDKARGLNNTQKKNKNIDFDNAEFFKMSLGGKNKPHIHSWCLNNNKLALGWGGDNDISHLLEYRNDWNLFKEKFIELYPEVSEDSRYNIQAIFIFLKMKKGDIVLVSKGNKIIDSIGIVTDNEYIFDPNQEFDYCHYRNVEWLATDLNASPDLFVSKQISQQTIYMFYDADIKKEYFKQKFNETEQTGKTDNYVMIIDEINRGNIAAIFGELITLIEPDKRLGAENEITVRLPYSGKNGKPFGVPSNLYIIGTMNTADRSVEALDTALRRRFSFAEMPPDYSLYELDYQFAGYKAADILKTINRRIERILDKDHLIGHSYFMKRKNEDAKTAIENALFDKIIPLLQEYFYGDTGKINLVLGNGFIKIENNSSDIFPESIYEKADYQEREIYKLIPRNEVNIEEAIKQMRIIVEQQ